MIDPARQRQLLEDYQRMYGPEPGRLAAILDLLTDAEILAGQHVPYCSKTRRDGSPAADLTDLTEHIRLAKRLLTESFQMLRRQA